jgi:predicted DNA-binding transcriptional regulator AlpA
MQNDILFTPLRIVELETLILNQVRIALSEINTPTQPDPDRWMNLHELIQYLPDHPKPQTVYSWCSSKMIPYNKGSKHLRFLKSEIDQWLKSGRRRTYAEMQLESKSGRK